jgi:hypothetical protein
MESLLFLPIFEAMGKILAEMILKGTKEDQIENKVL